MNPYRLLIIDDDAELIKDFMAIAVPVNLPEFEAEAVSSPDEALDLLISGSFFSVVLLDVHFEANQRKYQQRFARR